jgi:ATP-binding cassette subfamily B protein
MGLLVRFLYQNMKGLRALVVLAAIVTVLQVSCDITAAFPLKFIPSKVQNPGNDPACLFPFLNPIESWFDIPQIDPTLQPDPHFAPGFPVEAQCPIDPNNPRGRIVLVRHTTLGVIVFSLLLLIIFGLLSALLAFVDLYLAAYIGQMLTARLRNHLFDHLERLSLDWHSKQQKGDLVQRITGNITDIEKLVTDGLVDLLAGVLTLVGVVSVMLLLSPQYTFISLAIAPTLLIMVLGYTRSIKAATKKAAKATGQIGYVATEDINALDLIKVFTREAREAKRFGTYVEKNKRARMRAGLLQAQFTPLVSLLVIVGTAAVIGVGGYVATGNKFNIGPLTIAANSVDVGMLILFLIFLKLLYQPMRDLSKLATLATTAASGAERIQEVFDQAPEVLESEEPYTGEQKLKGDITFENVFFGYTKERNVLKGINLHIPAGRKVALVGYSGSGKTTLVKLIPRFYQLEHGSIKIDGVENSQYPLQVLRQNISMVLQDSILFEGTIRENLEIGRPGASLKLIIDAAKKANIHDMIMDMPDGYDTYVREQGNNFSAGQRQRLSIARAILRDSPILILDEPTANLDVEAESEVMHAINSLIVGRTVLTISHRLSTLGNVDEILVMQHGQIVERGTFKELKRNNGAFAKLLKEQNRYSPDHEEENSVHSIYASTSELISATAPLIAVTPVTSLQKRVNGYSATTSSKMPEYASSSQNREALEYQNGHHDIEINGRTPTKAQIIVQRDGKITGKYQLNKKIFTIGRYPTSDIQIPSARVSRLHATIRWQNGAWVIQDSESLNGLTCEGQRINQLALVNGDSISIDPTIVLDYEELTL